MMPDPALAAKESQAAACLLAAERYQPQLLALAVKLAGSREGGLDLFQDSLLNCHDAIQRHGFAGERYEFYLRAAIKHLHYRQAKERQRFLYLPLDFEAEAGERESGVFAELAAPAPGPTLDAYAQLAEQLASEVRASCSASERIALRLHADGYSYQDIADLVGLADRFRVRRLLDRIKAGLRQTFAQAWGALGE